jgi:hypothetical protein
MFVWSDSVVTCWGYCERSNSSMWAGGVAHQDEWRGLQTLWGARVRCGGKVADVTIPGSCCEDGEGQGSQEDSWPASWGQEEIWQAEKEIVGWRHQGSGSALDSRLEEASLGQERMGEICRRGQGPSWIVAPGGINWLTHLSIGTLFVFSAFKFFASFLGMELWDLLWEFFVVFNFGSFES